MRTAYTMLLPQLAGFALFVVVPLAWLVYLSLTDYSLISGRADFIGVDGYRETFQDPLFRTVLWNTAVFTLGMVPLNIALALALALMLDRSFRGRTFFRLAFFAPVATSAVAWALVWRFILQGEQQGVLNQGLSLVGMEGPNWLVEPGWAMGSIIATRVLKGVGINMLILLAALQTIPSETLEAAKVDGATPWKAFRHVKVPLLAPALLLVTVITTIGSLQVFDTILLMTGGGPANSTNVLVSYVFFRAFRTFDIGYASRLALIIFVISAVLTVLQWRARRKLVYLES